MVGAGVGVAGDAEGWTLPLSGARISPTRHRAVATAGAGRTGSSSSTTILTTKSRGKMEARSNTQEQRDTGMIVIDQTKRFWTYLGCRLRLSLVQQSIGRSIVLLVQVLGHNHPINS